MIHHIAISNAALKNLLRKQEIRWGGNKKLKIFGTLTCSTGKRMKRENRVFFFTEQDALNAGYRPCGHCMRTEYNHWKNGSVQ